MNERRQKGNGCISQRKDGKWTARIDLGKDENGNRKIKAFYGNSKSEVKQKLKDFQEKNKEYNCSVAYKLTFAELLIYWLENVKRNELKASSYDRLEITINKHIIPLLAVPETVVSSVASSSLKFKPLSFAYLCAVESL